MHIQPFGRGRGQREAPVFIEDDEAAIDVQKIGARQTAVAPRDLAGLDVDGHKRRRAEITARSEDQVAHANAVAEMHAHHVMRPHFFDCGFIAVARKFDDAAAAAVGRRDEEQIVFAPDRRAGVEAVLGLMRMAPQH